MRYLQIMNTMIGRIAKYENSSRFKIFCIVFVMAISLVILQNIDFAFSQIGEDTSLGPNASNITNTSSFLSNDGLSSTPQQPSGFVSNGKINAVINVPNGKWLAAGNWTLTVNNGNVTSFEIKTTWYNSSGTNAHSHDLMNFKSASDISGNTQMLPITTSNKQTTIKGFTDIASNGKVSWVGVPTTITINDGKIISISVDDLKTNHHFNGQPLLGIVDSFEPCSDLPGPNMEVLASCTVETGPTFPPSDQITSQGSFPSDNFSQQGGFPDQGFPSDNFSQQGGFPDQGFPSDDFSQQGGSTQGQFPTEDGQSGGQVDGQTGGSEINPECTDLDIENATASGFESDPSDYHPPADAIDGDSSTWWSNNGKDPWIELSLAKSHPICGIGISWNKGDTRNYSFEVEVSEDGNNFEKVFEGNHKKGTSEQETYPFEQQTNGKYIKLTITSTNSKDGWASIKEITALGLANR